MSTIVNNRIMSDSVNTTNSTQDESKHRMYRRATVLVAVVFLATTFTAGWITQQVVSSRLEGFFQSQADQIADTYHDHIQTQVLILEGIRGLWNASEKVTLNEYNVYLDSLDLASIEQSGVSSYFYIRAVPRVDIPNLQFKIHPESSSDPVYPVTYVYPLKGRETTIGLDFGTYTERLAAINYAKDTGLLTTTGNTILQTTGKNGFFMMIPLYNPKLPLETVAERRIAFVGLVGAAFRSESAFKQIYGTTDPYPHLDFQIYQGETIERQHLLYDHNEWEVEKPPKFETKRTIRLGGQTWAVMIQSKPSLTLGDSEGRLPVYIFLGGLISTILAISLSLKNYIKHLKTHSKLN